MNENTCKFCHTPAPYYGFICDRCKPIFQAGERQFILNVLDGIDIADKEMWNTGGGTKAIRFALQSRLIN